MLPNVSINKNFWYFCAQGNYKGLSEPMQGSGTEAKILFLAQRQPSEESSQ